MGLLFGMYYNDHPPAHFHAIYGNHQAVISIENLALLHGKLPARALGLVMEWAALHQNELLQAWQQARNAEPLGTIEPLA